MSDVNTALANVDAFAVEPWQLDRQDVLTRLRQLLRDPNLINQRGLNACGPAVFFRIWLARDPEEDGGLRVPSAARRVGKDGLLDRGAELEAPGLEVRDPAISDGCGSSQRHTGMHRLDAA